MSIAVEPRVVERAFQRAMDIDASAAARIISQAAPFDTTAAARIISQAATFDTAAAARIISQAATFDTTGIVEILGRSLASSKLSADWNFTTNAKVGLATAVRGAFASIDVAELSRSLAAANAKATSMPSGFDGSRAVGVFVDEVNEASGLALSPQDLTALVDEVAASLEVQAPDEYSWNVADRRGLQAFAFTVVVSLILWAVYAVPNQEWSRAVESLWQAFGIGAAPAGLQVAKLAGRAYDSAAPHAEPDTEIS